MSTSTTKHTERYKVFHRKGLLIITLACVLIFIGFSLETRLDPNRRSYTQDAVH